MVWPRLHGAGSYSDSGRMGDDGCILPFAMARSLEESTRVRTADDERQHEVKGVMKFGK
jgi:hypothetical protein